MLQHYLFFSFRTIVVSMGLVLLLSHDLQGTEKGLLLIKGFAEQDFTNYSLDSKLGALYNGIENNTDTTNAEVSHIGFLKVHKAGVQRCKTCSSGSV